MTKVKLTGKISDINIGFLDDRTKLTLEINEKNDLCTGYDELKDCDKLSIEIKPYRKKRSLDANSYMWVLCDKLAEKIGCTKLDVYRQHILNAGVSRQAIIDENAVDTLAHIWRMTGIGWLAERVDGAGDPGYVLVNLYYGSSTYNTKQMARLLDSVIEDCKEQGIQTETPDEIAKMKALWKGGG